LIKVNTAVFRHCDTRGIVACVFDNDFVRDLGRACATMLARTGKRTIAAARDYRLSSDRLFAAIVESLAVSDVKVIEIGIATRCTASPCIIGTLMAA
jgi:phosphomannomutase/phosphoglucomutase